MDTTSFFQQSFEQLQAKNGSSGLEAVRQKAFREFKERGIPAGRNEEWKYTRIGTVLNKDFQLALQPSSLTAAALEPHRLPGHKGANELFFVNGIFSETLSTIRSASLTVMSLEQAVHSEYGQIVTSHLGHSSLYQKDGINALNTAFVHGGVFIHAKKGRVIEHPVYLYNIIDARSVNILAQPRSLVHVGENAQVQFVETSATLGLSQSFNNSVVEIVVEKDAILEFYKIQNDAGHISQVSTTHIRQVGKSYIHTVTISLGGRIVRNNLNIVMEADHAEAHLYGLYFLHGETHVDNHTVVDNVKPNCFSNELYKGVINDKATGVFNGKIFVRPQAQKTNAYQSNKNILLSDTASVNTKPQLEIFADDVKCSHGCTIGQLDEEGMFYLRSRGIGEDMARAMLVHAFAIDILEHIKPVAIRSYVDQLISERLECDIV